MATSYFRLSEFRCKCGRKECDAVLMNTGFMLKVNSLRSLYGKPMYPNSGSRCHFWNEHEGGSPKSQHVLGMAADFKEFDKKKQAKISELAEKLGFGGIGLYDWGVHVDDGPRGRRWDFRSK